MDIKQELHNVYHSRGSTVVIVIVGSVIVGLLIFHAGVAYGERHAFGRMHGFGVAGMPTPGFAIFTHGFIPNDHGAVGTITSIASSTTSASSTITVQTRDGETEEIRTTARTIVHGPTQSSVADLTVGDSIAIIGEPEDATDGIDAMLIRVLPPLPDQSQQMPDRPPQGGGQRAVIITQ